METKKTLLVLAVSIVIVLLMLLFITSCRGQKSDSCVIPTCKPWPAISSVALCNEVAIVLCDKHIDVCGDVMEVPTELRKDFLYECKMNMFDVCLEGDPFKNVTADVVYDVCIPAVRAESCETLVENGDKLSLLCGGV